jgi:hypothetical protein
MNSYYKDIVRAMVANHIQEDSNQFRDLVDGKGQGVVILLHGKLSVLPTSQYLTWNQVHLELVKR